MPSPWRGGPRVSAGSPADPTVTTAPADYLADDSCEVRIGGEAVRYRRVGNGPSVLLLCDDARGGDWRELVAVLGGSHRVILPRVRPADGLRARLAGFLEGLGASPICIVAGPEFCGQSLELVALAEEQMARIVIIAADDAEARDIDATLVRARPSGPVLLLHRRAPAESVIPSVLRFIGEPEDRPPG